MLVTKTDQSLIYAYQRLQLESTFRHSYDNNNDVIKAAKLYITEKHRINLKFRLKECEEGSRDDTLNTTTINTQDCNQISLARWWACVIIFHCRGKQVV